MKKGLFIGTSTLLATMLVACTGAGGSTTDPVETVYGPPTEITTPDDDPVEDVYGPPIGDYGDDATASDDDIYDDEGDEEDSESDGTDEDAQGESVYTAPLSLDDRSTIAGVYGPPTDF